MRPALPLLLLAGCAGWAEPTKQDLFPLGMFEAEGFIQERIPYIRGRAVVDVGSPWFAGRFTAALVARTGTDPAVRLQLLPDLGGKAVDLFVSPTRLRGRFPHTGEEIDWALPGDARAHPLLFIGLTILEEFASAQGRVTGYRQAGESHVYRIRGLVPPADVELTVNPTGISSPLYFSERRFAWKGGTWTLHRTGVDAPRTQVRLSDVRLESAAPDVESQLK